MFCYVHYKRRRNMIPGVLFSLRKFSSGRRLLEIGCWCWPILASVRNNDKSPRLFVMSNVVIEALDEQSLNMLRSQWVKLSALCEFYILYYILMNEHASRMPPAAINHPLVDEYFYNSSGDCHNGCLWRLDGIIKMTYDCYIQHRK